ncbi:hypothetical protein ABVT39_012640 [Epinephelus coioides]
MAVTVKNTLSFNISTLSAHDSTKSISLIDSLSFVTLYTVHHPHTAILNTSVPILQLFFDPTRDIRLDLRLTRTSLNALLQMVHREDDHGWGHTIEILTFVYWLAHGLSYRVVARVFDVPKSTVCRHAHKIAHEIKQLIRQGKVIHYPHSHELDNIGEGFAHLADTMLSKMDATSK